MTDDKADKIIFLLERIAVALEKNNISKNEEPVKLKKCVNCNGSMQGANKWSALCLDCVNKPLHKLKR